LKEFRTKTSGFFKVNFLVGNLNLRTLTSIYVCYPVKRKNVKLILHQSCHQNVDDAMSISVNFLNKKKKNTAIMKLPDLLN